MNPKVSVVIKSFNHEKYVVEAINSILNQSFQDFEIVITDDASSDKTADLISSFKDPRIHLEVSKLNRGISLTMNATLNRARGEYVAILNSDDIALPGRLENQVHYLDLNPQVAAVFSLPIEIDEEGAQKQLGGKFQEALKLSNSSRNAWLRQFFYQGNCLCAPTAMIRRTAIIDCGGYDPRLSGLNDFDYWLRMLSKGYNLQVLPEVATAFRVRSNLQNASAPTFFNLTRVNFEHSKVLNHFRSLPRELIIQIFQSDIQAHKISLNLTSDQLLIELALKSSSIPIYLFALNTLFEIASSLEEYNVLRNASGNLDIFRIAKSAIQNTEILELQEKLAAKLSHNKIDK